LAIFKVPITNSAYSTFAYSLEGEIYSFTLRYNRTTGSWYMDLEGGTDTIVIRNIKLVTNLRLIRQHGYQQIGEFLLLDQEKKEEDPDEYGLGDRWILLYIEKDTF